jgi:hypothetical protein
MHFKNFMEIKIRKSFEISKENTNSLCSADICKHLKVFKSHILIVLSNERVASLYLSIDLIALI